MFTNQRTADFINRLVQLTTDTVALCASIDFKTGLKPVCDQVIRSSGSIGANIVEGQAASTTKDYTHFFNIALKSANETLYWLYVLEKAHPEQLASITKLQAEVDSIRKILGKSIVTLKNKSNK